MMRMMIKQEQANQDGDYGGGETGTLTIEKPKAKKPPLYKVIMLNDDYTPMEFVIFVLQEFFRKTQEEAVQIMLNIHQKGSGVCGVYTYEVAETKAKKVTALARKNQHPLQVQIEKE